jgi:hypothetical protein
MAERRENWPSYETYTLGSSIVQRSSRLLEEKGWGIGRYIGYGTKVPTYLLGESDVWNSFFDYIARMLPKDPERAISGTSQLSIFQEPINVIVERDGFLRLRKKKTIIPRNTLVNLRISIQRTSEYYFGLTINSSKVGESILVTRFEWQFPSDGTQNPLHIPENQEERPATIKDLEAFEKFVNFALGKRG